MNKADALQLFRNKLGQDDDEACVEGLAMALEYMPLAITQAAAYIVQMRPRSSVRKYLNEFQDSDRRKTKLLNREGAELRRDKETKNSILITWQISFDHIRETRPSAADLLSLISFCDRQGIPEVLMRGKYGRVAAANETSLCGEINALNIKDAQSNVAENESIGSDSESDWTEKHSSYSEEDRFEGDIITLRSFSFIVAKDNPTTFEMHRLVQLATLEWLRVHSMYEQWNYQFLQCLCAELPGGAYEDWATCQLLFPHAQHASTQHPEGRGAIEAWATILFRAGWYAQQKGEPKEAKTLAIRSMKARKKIFSDEHEAVIESTSLLSSVYIDLGRWREAEKLALEAVEMCKTTLGADHSYTLAEIHNLLYLYLRESRWDEAETLALELVQIRKAKLGADHPVTLNSMSTLIWTYCGQGRLNESEKVGLEVVEKMKTILGEDHLATLQGMNNLAATYWKQNRFKEFDELNRQVMEMRKTKLGEDHPATLTSISNLAASYSIQGRLEEAEKLTIQMIETYKRKLGPDHPHARANMHNLAIIYWDQGRFEEADKLSRSINS